MLLATTAEVVTAVFTGVGGVAGAVAAVAAWRSADASRAVSRDAREALANSIEPDVHAGYGNVEDDHGVLVHNQSVHPAIDVEAEVRRRDCRIVRTTAATIPQIQTWKEYLFLDDGEGRRLVDPYEVFEDVFVWYWDSQRVARYEIRLSFNTKRDDPDRLPGGEMERRRIAFGDR